jgi:nucleoside-diphosphate-sugar epimerase
MARVLIAGCGYVGRELAIRLAAEGDEVFALRRSEAAPIPGVTAIRADLSDATSLSCLPSGVEVAFYSASAGGTEDLRYQRAYVDGARNLVAALAGHPMRRFIYASSTGVYAQLGGEWVDEDSPAEPTHFSGLRLLEGEDVARRSGFPATVVRLAGIYGPGRASLVERVRSGEATIPAEGVSFANRIHRDDSAGVLRHVMRLDRPASLYCAADDEPAELATVLRWIADQLDRPPPRTAPQPAVGRYGRVSNKRVRSARLLASGYRFRYPTFREGYAELIARAEPARS